MSSLRTPLEWMGIKHPDMVIHDPDGWRGPQGRPFTDPIDEAEFDRRYVQCTISNVPVEDSLQKMRERFRGAEREIADLEAENELLRAALTEIADGYERHNPGWWIKKAKAALAMSGEQR